MATEKTLQAKICKFCRTLSILAYKFESPSQRGVPDLLLVYPHGHVLFMEVKSPTGRGRLSKLQDIQIRKLTENGADVHVVDDYEAAKEIITSRLDARAKRRD